jgi:hypothetical protein
MTTYTEIEILKIKPCGCDAEGEIHIFLPAYSKNLIAYYQGSDYQISQSLPEGTKANVLLYLVWGTINKSKSNERSLSQIKGTNSYKVTGIYREIVKVTDLVLHLIESEFPIFVNPESVKTIPYANGEWVESEGTFFVDYL